MDTFQCITLTRLRELPLKILWAARTRQILTGQAWSKSGLQSMAGSAGWLLRAHEMSLRRLCDALHGEADGQQAGEHGPRIQARHTQRPL